ncbi:MAG TPA: DegT/DnrJ/EryC1/StrS aminotransferase family protein [Mariniphaga anaerophila]|uniref:DegT/DnrJ/EryC1/StrS aminotransferase family protein n=1 Tax=Mariniphaga anaerophila TaxID=1484053 RepID=A0A831LQE5_9BACT|nr:DegT/DnrJ/EryC1/StrS aminotransferase family protein [Mariniphaga anaerophila]
MINKSNPKLAINGGKPVSEDPILIHKPYLDEEDFAAVDRAMRSTFVSGNGPECREFEKKLAEYLGVKHVLFTNSCTTAIDLAFRVKGFAPGSEVIVPNFTYTSTALGPILNQLKVVLCDVYADNGNIDVSKIEERITKKTVAIAPVDYAGNPADMDSILEIARKYHLYVVHDTAQSIGSLYRGRKTGSLAHVSTFSFHGTKNITTGEGGALVTNDDEIADRAMLMREKGTDKQSFLVDNRDRGFYQYVDVGSSYVQSNVLGALGLSQLAKIDRMNARREEIAAYYLENLKEIPNIRSLRITVDSKTNWHIFGILVPPENRYWIMDAIRAEGVHVNVHYTPLHRNKFYQHLGSDDELPDSMKFFGGLLRLPIYPSLTDEEMTKVMEAVRKVVG